MPESGESERQFSGDSAIRDASEDASRIVEVGWHQAGVLAYGPPGMLLLRSASFPARRPCGEVVAK